MIDATTTQEVLTLGIWFGTGMGMGFIAVIILGGWAGYVYGQEEPRI